MIHFYNFLGSRTPCTRIRTLESKKPNRRFGISDGRSHYYIRVIFIILFFLTVAREALCVWGSFNDVMEAHGLMGWWGRGGGGGVRRRRKQCAGLFVMFTAPPLPLRDIWTEMFQGRGQRWEIAVGRKSWRTKRETALCCPLTPPPPPPHPQIRHGGKKKQRHLRLELHENPRPLRKVKSVESDCVHLLVRGRQTDHNPGLRAGVREGGVEGGGYYWTLLWLGSTSHTEEE